MKEIILYSTGCPKCTILKEKLSNKNIKYKEVNDIDTMLELGIERVPMLKIDDKLLDYKSANSWINEYNA